MKRINFNQRPTPVARGSSRATYKNSLNACGNWCRLFLFPLVSPTWLCSESVVFLCPFQSLYHVLSSGVNHNANDRGWLLPSPSLADSQTWVSSTTRGRRFAFWGLPLYPIKWVSSKDGTTWELIRGLGYSGSSLSSWW